MRKELPLAIIAIVVILGVCYGLAAVRPNLPATPSTPFSATTGQKSPVTNDKNDKNDKVVMRVNGEPITEREFNAFLQQAPEQMQAYYASPDGRRTLAEQLVKLKTLEQEGRKLGIDNDPEAKSRIEVAKANIVAAYALQKLVGQPSDQRMRAEYEKQKNTFDTVQLYHILIAYQGGGVPPRTGTPPSEADAMKKAQAIEGQLHRGADFGQVAHNESDDLNSAAEGGRIGEISPASLPQEVQSTVASLKENQVSQPVKSQYGIHIFKAGAHTGRKFEEMKPMFAAKIQRDEAEATLNRLQKSAKVELDPQFFRPVAAPPVPPPPRRGRS
ncbi:MAG TPA: peptidylprolyl isomerase [Thermoanaerobaculia bacterium]